MIIRRTSRARAAALLAIPLLALSLAACSAPPTPETEGDATETDPKQWALDFAECMREQGIDMEDPGEGGAIGLGPEEETPERQAATQVCLEQVGPSPLGPGSSDGAAGGPSADEMREELLALAKCLRDLGYDVEDPAPGEGIHMPADLTEDAIEQCAEFAPVSVPGE